MRSALAVVMLVTLACGAAAPPGGSALSVPQLQFRVMDAAGKPAWCDPDFWPLVVAGREQQNAIARYPQIKSDTDVYAAIVAHEHLPSGDLDDAQKLILYRAWKLLTPVTLTKDGGGYTFDYTVAGRTDYERVAGRVTVDGTVTVENRTQGQRPNCPICLAASTKIATPGGPVRVTDIQVGSVVWTQDRAGRRVAAPVVALGSLEAPAGHRMVHLVLADGRELFVSPGHRTADGRQVGTLSVGDALDGSTIASLELVPYASLRTYDLRPAGATGFYWADGILLASTIAG